MIDVRGVSKYYGPIAALDDVTFEVGAGEIVGFLGPNGAGKTTMMRILTGFMPATRGTVKIAGTFVEDDPIAVKRQIGYVPENVPLYPEMLVRSYLTYVATVKGVARSKRRREADRVMELCGLSHMTHRVIQNLSKGYRQRVGLAQALIGDPPVLILDEPTVGLDPKQIIEIRNMIRDLSTNHTILLSTHILPEVSMLCQRVLIIDRGRIVTEDTMANLSGAASNRWELVLNETADTVLHAVRAVPGVASAEVDDGVIFIAANEGADPIPGLTQAIAAHGASIRRLVPLTRTLEEAFVQVVAKDAPVTKES